MVAHIFQGLLLLRLVDHQPCGGLHGQNKTAEQIQANHTRYLSESISQSPVELNVCMYVEEKRCLALFLKSCQFPNDKHIRPDLRIEWKAFVFGKKSHNLPHLCVVSTKSLPRWHGKRAQLKLPPESGVQIAFEYLDRRAAHFIRISKYAYCRLCAKNDLMEKEKGKKNRSRAGCLRRLRFGGTQPIHHNVKKIKN